jgi:hypothetical protein
LRSSIRVSTIDKILAHPLGGHGIHIFTFHDAILPASRNSSIGELQFAVGTAIVADAAEARSDEPGARPFPIQLYNVE